MTGYFLKKVKVDSMFESSIDLEMEFSEETNCIHGRNGSGKTQFINLIVNAIKCNVEYLLDAPFEEAIIYISKRGQKKDIELFKIKKSKNRSVTYTLSYKDLFGAYNEIARKLNTDTISSKTIELDSTRGPHRGLFSDFDDKKRAVLKQAILHFTKLTDIPLTRLSDGANVELREFQFSRSFRDYDESEIMEFIDPTLHELKRIQDEFVKLYASSQSNINKESDKLKSKIFKFFLIKKDLLESNRSNVYPDTDWFERVASLYSDESRKSIDLSIVGFSQSETEEQIRIVKTINENFKSAENKIVSIRKSNPNKEDIEKASEEFTEWFWRAISARRQIDNFTEVLSLVKDFQSLKESYLSVFNRFADTVNAFFEGDKKFVFGEDGKFKITRNDKPISLDKLSSGEKHIIVILGKVALTSSEASIYIADEPELSLHMSWQRMIIPAIRDLSANSQIIVATHSPAIAKDGLVDIMSCYKRAKK